MWARAVVTVADYTRTASDMATLLDRAHIIVTRSWVPVWCMAACNVDPLPAAVKRERIGSLAGCQRCAVTACSGPIRQSGPACSARAAPASYEQRTHQGQDVPRHLPSL
jgi:hypothetical protein